MNSKTSNLKNSVGEMSENELEEDGINHLDTTEDHSEDEEALLHLRQMQNTPSVGVTDMGDSASLANE